jgi:hypothetical protein
MPPEQYLADYLAGAMADRERAGFEAELTAHPERLREWVEQRRLDAALGALLDARSDQIKAAIMASVRGATPEAAEARVLEATVHAKPAPGWRTAWKTILDWRPVQMRWRWAGVAVVVVLVGPMDTIPRIHEWPQQFQPGCGANLDPVFQHRHDQLYRSIRLLAGSASRLSQSGRLRQ